MTIKGIKNGDIVNGIRYNRKYDFQRDSWHELVYKLLLWKNKKTKLKYIHTIKKILNERIKKNSCSKEQINTYKIELRTRNYKNLIVCYEMFGKINI
jgi:hypothetical protein